MKRWISLTVTLAFLAGCSGMGSGGLTPNLSSFAPQAGSAGSRHKVHLRIRMTIPKRHRGQRTPVHPSTISSSTQSVSFAINGATAQIFNATPTSPGCVVGSGGTTCTFSVGAPPGSDAFAIKTYSAINGGGSVLDYGTATINVVAGQNNSATITLGPVVTSTLDSGMGSLRYAVGSANPGDTIVFLLAAGTTITLSSPITPSTTVTIAGPGVTSAVRRHAGKRGVHSNVTFSGLTLSGNNLKQIFVINSGVTATISGLIMTQGNATVPNQPGGDIYNAGTLTLTDDAFSASASVVDSPFITRPRSHALPHHGKPRAPAVRLHPNVCAHPYNYGGALYNHGTMTINGSFFDSNVAMSDFYGGGVHCTDGYGGAIYNDEYGQLSVNTTSFTNNSAYEGGAVYNDSSYGQATFTSDTFIGNAGCDATSGCPTAGCTGSGCTTYAAGYGGAIYDSSGPGVSIASSTFTNNVAGGASGESNGYGGALYLDSGQPVVTGSTFTGNLAGGGGSDCSNGEGGAIYASEPLVINNDTFTNNQAGGDEYGYGGAIYTGEPLVGNTDTFSNNTAFGSGSPCYAGAYGYGGAVYEDSSYPMNFVSSTFTSNTATGAYYAYAGALYFDDGGSMIASTFTSNVAIGTGVTNEYPYAYGGAVYISSGTTRASGGTTFTSNVAKALGPQGEYAEGGAVYNSGTFASAASTYTSNAVLLPGLYSSAESYGGAVYSGGTFTSNGDTFKSNVASAPGYEAEGGAILANSSLTISNGTFTSNSATAPYVYGGALYNENTTASINNTTFTSNTAGTSGQQAYGGAIYDDGGLTVSGSVLSNNTAVVAGGGAYMDTTDTIANSTITGNTVTQAGSGYGGGGVFADGPTTIANSTISGNTVTVAAFKSGGGGVFNDDAVTITGTTISGNSVLGNVAASGGGGVFGYSTGTFANDTITGNSSSVDGGGIEEYYSGGYLNLFNVTIFQNKATGNGGNVYNAYLMSMTNSIAAGGTAGGSGADVYNYPSATLASGDYNIIQTAIVGGGTVSGTTTHNLTADPKLLALSNNGGSTFTNADQAGSPGAAYIPFAASNCGNASSLNFDQRNFTRGAGGKCDVGAFELGGVPSAIRARIPRPAASTGHKHHHHPRNHTRRPD